MPFWHSMINIFYLEKPYETPYKSGILLFLCVSHDL